MKRMAVVLLGLVLALAAGRAEAAPPLDLTPRIGNVAWSSSVEQVLADYREQMVARFRKRAAGNSDPVKVEELRRDVDASLKRAAESLEAFEGPRTGYETSFISGEFQPGTGVTMLTVRPTASLTGQFHYYVFTEGKLSKVLVSYPLTEIDFQSVEKFSETLATEFGPPDEVLHRLDDIGIRLVSAVSWNDGKTRVRLIERPAAVGGHLLVIEDATKPIVTGQVDASIRPRRSIADLLGGEAVEPEPRDEE